MSPPGLGLGKRVYTVCWMELRPVAGRMEKEGGSLIGRRGEGSTSWSVAQMRREGSSALFVILRQKDFILFSHKGRG